jgi:hypothetical protein
MSNLGYQATTSVRDYPAAQRQKKRPLNEPLRGGSGGDGSLRRPRRFAFRCPLSARRSKPYDGRRTIPPGPGSPASSRRELSGRSSGRRHHSRCGLISRRLRRDHPARCPWNLCAEGLSPRFEAALEERRHSHGKGPTPAAINRTISAAMTCDHWEASLALGTRPSIEIP